MKKQLAKIRAEALAAFDSVKDAAALDELRVRYLGKKGELTAVLKQMGKLSAEERPAMGQLANEVRAAVERGSKLIVVDPRDIRIADAADIHLKLRPGTNVAFANGFARALIHAGLADKAFIEERTEGFAAFAAMVEAYTPERVAEICHIDPDDLVAAAELYGMEAGRKFFGSYRIPVARYFDRPFVCNGYFGPEVEGAGQGRQGVGPHGEDLCRGFARGTPQCCK